MEECGNDVTVTFSARNQRPAYASEVAPGMTATAIGHMAKKVFAASDALRSHRDSRRRHWRLSGFTKILKRQPAGNQYQDYRKHKHQDSFHHGFSVILLL